jgi:hypothetical protein
MSEKGVLPKGEALPQSLQGEKHGGDKGGAFLITHRYHLPDSPT